MKHIPNILSCMRLVMVGLFAYFFQADDFMAAFVIYAAAFFTDILDGYLARRNNWITNLGKILDPLADKLLVLCALFCFYLRGWLPLFIPLIAAVKEFAMLLGGLIMLRRKKVVVISDKLGKFAAGFFNVSVLVTLISNFQPFQALSFIVLPLFSIAIILALAAMIHYGRTQILPQKEQG